MKDKIKKILWKKILFPLGMMGVMMGLMTSCVPAAYSATPSKTQIPTVSIQQVGSASVLSQAKPLADFALQATNEQPFTKNSLRGHWTLLFFGYAHCPEICPRTLAIVSELWRSYPEKTPHPKAQFVFVSLDPKTDTPTRLKTFLQAFNPQFLGLTGEESEINKLAKDCRIYRFNDTAASNTVYPGQKMIDHSATLLLIDPEGKIKAFFSPPHTSPTLAEDLRTLMKSS